MTWRETLKEAAEERRAIMEVEKVPAEIITQTIAKYYGEEI